jgi:alkylhydroperoxidase family enzyme
MPRLRPIDAGELDPDLRDICLDHERQTGTSASTRTLAHNPPVVRALAAFRAALAKESVLDPSLKELTRLQVARANACHY